MHAPGSVVDLRPVHQEPTLPNPVTTPARSNAGRSSSGRPASVLSLLRSFWEGFKERLGGGDVDVPDTNLSSSEHLRNSPPTIAEPADENQSEDSGVEVVVVENRFSLGSDPAERPKVNIAPEVESPSTAVHTTEQENAMDLSSWGHLSPHSVAFGRRLRNMAASFFFLRFEDPMVEFNYRKDIYHEQKRLALAGSVVLIMNWVLYCILTQRRSLLISDKIFYYGVAPVLTLPLPVLVLFDWPRTHHRTYQLLISVSAWSWSAYTLLILQLCGFYDSNQAVLHCPGREFFNAFYYTCAFPFIALFALGQSRIMAAVFGLFTAGLIASVIPDKHTWIRNLLNYLLFMAFVLFLHRQKDAASRRMFTMQSTAKTQLGITRLAQRREASEADSKRRFTSYIFHEIRVPLNTALIAVQNLTADGVLPQDSIEHLALTGSLKTMSQVLNDVLDFNRMDSGRFESVAKPFAFHDVLKSMLIPVQMTASGKGLDLVWELDESIDKVANMALLRAQGVGLPDAASRTWDPSISQVAGQVVGDEHRLRQIITNLASNAVKFTPRDGTIRIRTKLLVRGFGSLEPHSSPITSLSPPQGLTPTSGSSPPVPTSGQWRPHDLSLLSMTDQMVIRIEVEDTGVGILKKDMLHNKLFSPYVQTDLGKLQGGKGTGLGLSLTKQIVRSSGGRLGVESKRGHGSTFWLELPFGIGRPVVENTGLNSKDEIVAESFGVSRSSTDGFSMPISQSDTRPSIHELVNMSPTLPYRPSTLPAVPPVPDRLPEHLGGINSVRLSSPEGDLSLLGATHPSPPLNRPRRITLPPPQSFTSDGTKPSQLKDSHLQLPTPITSSVLTSTLGGPSTASPFPSPRSDSHLSPIIFDPALSVLVVDDDSTTRMLMSRMLTRLGCTIATAENGQMALDMLTRPPDPFKSPMHSPQLGGQRGENDSAEAATSTGVDDGVYDIVFLDNQMPVMSGVELVRRLRELGRSDLVVGVTGNALKEDQQEYLDAGVDAVVTKPLMEGKLKNCLKAARDRRQALGRPITPVPNPHEA